MPRPGAFSLGNEAFGDNVIHVTGKAGLTTAHPPQHAVETLTGHAIDGSSSGSLQPRPQPAVAHTDTVERLAAMHFAVGIGGDVDDAHIHAQEVVGRDGRLVGVLDDGHQVVGAIPEDQLGGGLDVLEQPFLVLAHDHADTDTAVECGKRHFVQVQKAQEPRIIRQAGTRLEGRLDALVAAQDSSDTGKDGTSKVGGQVERAAHVVVVQLVQLEPIGKLPLKGAFRHPIAGVIEPLYRGIERFGLLGVRRQLDLHDTFHEACYEHYNEGCQADGLTLLSSAA